MANGPTHLNDEIQKEAERLLMDAEIWQLSSFGWRNADDPDPEFIGHAKWQVEPPIDNAMIFNARANYKAEMPTPPDWLKTIAVAGADFEGLMEAARMSMGLLLISIDASKENDFGDDLFFDLHRMSALMYLATASERLREVFIGAAFRQGQAEYDKLKGNIHGKPRRRFLSPFLEAADRLPDSDCLRKLIILAPDIVSMRNERNILVHEIATGIAQRERDSHARQNRPLGTATFQELQTMRVAIRKRFADERAAIMASLSARYTLLVITSNEVFNFENFARRRA